LVITKLPSMGLSLQHLTGCDYNRTSLVFQAAISMVLESKTGFPWGLFSSIHRCRM